MTLEAVEASILLAFQTLGYKRPVSGIILLVLVVL